MPGDILGCHVGSKKLRWFRQKFTTENSMAPNVPNGEIGSHTGEQKQNKSEDLVCGLHCPQWLQLCLAQRHGPFLLSK